ncbi:MAG: PTS system mannose/fructose/sorbose family transporter subunit IID [Tractidigestivibacter sp.]|uniref:PTS system mannose/fructose/sorbose family transporter subunit IID n=1 Tax=Tractidigestivibacter sp. TaxID=2847320 RepID=UPI002A7F056B|nr:PTS system mannose/fructose/sorbose family transporter subunit IID [Tractidigestivibacter sp.]MDY4535163.1 PTS system mannose/fructose/sorbose family transporter subunit IID [Tractidigestivibacter sp.]
MATETIQSTGGADEGRRLTNKDLNTIWLRWAFTHLASMSYEKLQGHAYAWSYIPFANKYYMDDPEAKRRLLVRHSVFFNTEPQTGQIINGIVTSLEENIALGGEVSEEMPNNIKATLMGPLAGIGDSIIQGIIVPTLLSIGMSLASGGSPLGPLFYIVAYGIIGPTISFISYRTGYKLGVGAIDVIVGENARRVMDAFNVLGIMVVGALAAGNIALTTTVNIPLGSEWQPLQTTLDGVFPALLPLIAVLLTWWMLGKKQFSPTKVIVVLTIAISALCLIGVF